jgi:hypothetical protein
MTIGGITSNYITNFIPIFRSKIDKTSKPDHMLTSKFNDFMLILNVSNSFPDMYNYLPITRNFNYCPRQTIRSLTAPG